jgi:hypothetical protein
MKRFFTRFFFLVAMLACATGANAYVNGDRLTIDGITYQVKDASAKTLYVVAISTEKTGEVTIPATVFDGKDLTFTVVSLGYGNGISLHSGITGFDLPNTLEIINYNAFNSTSITSISSLVDGSEVMGDGQTYNLQGVRVSDAASKGIYIKNGKKFVVK